MAIKVTLAHVMACVNMKVSRSPLCQKTEILVVSAYVEIEISLFVYVKIRVFCYSLIKLFRDIDMSYKKITYYTNYNISNYIKRTITDANTIIIIIIYHDFLHTPRRGSHVKSDKTHTQSSRYTP